MNSDANNEEMALISECGNSDNNHEVDDSVEPQLQHEKAEIQHCSPITEESAARNEEPPAVEETSSVAIEALEDRPPLQEEGIPGGEQDEASLEPTEASTACEDSISQSELENDVPNPTEVQNDTSGMRAIPWSGAQVAESKHGVPNLREIMHEQEKELQQQQDDEFSVEILQMQEEEIVRLALERSLSELHAEMSPVQYSGPSVSHRNAPNHVQRYQSEQSPSNDNCSTSRGTPSPRRITLRRMSSGHDCETSPSVTTPQSAFRHQNFRTLSRPFSGRDAVLEVAKQNLSPREVAVIEQALQATSNYYTPSPPNSNGLSGSGIPLPGPPLVGSDVQRSSMLDRVATGIPVVVSDSRQRLRAAEELRRMEFTTGVVEQSSSSSSSHMFQLPTSRAPNNISLLPSPMTTRDTAEEYDLSGAQAHLSPEELRQIAEALGAPPSEPLPSSSIHSHNSDSEAADTLLSQEEVEAIERAIREADEEQERQSYQLAMRMLEEENRRNAEAARRTQQQGNVRTLSRAEYEAERRGLAFQRTAPSTVHSVEEQYGSDQYASAGFRMNSTAPQQWNRRDQNSVVGPNHEIRTKHDVNLNAQANAHRLGLWEGDGEAVASVGNRAFNSFLQSVEKTNKGVASHGTGRADSDTSGTKGGAMDPQVRIQLSRAINSGIIEKLNGAVKEGKEAVVYHAEKGTESEGFDVAVKVFKRIQEFKARADYVDGDPRYANTAFRKAGKREQLELWAEKEFRNLVRADRAGVPVPSPLLQKENIILMRFLGIDGWPAPQLRELNLRPGSKGWKTLYVQIMEAIRRLYKKARLVHGDLSEYNVMIVPVFLVADKVGNAEKDKEKVKAVLIDFGQAVDTKHPDAGPLLQRDIDRISTFFERKGVRVKDTESALEYVMGIGDKSGDEPKTPADNQQK